MGPAPGEAGDDTVARREQLIDLIVPIGERHPDALDVAFERIPPMLDRAERPAEVDVLRQDLVSTSSRHSFQSSS